MDVQPSTGGMTSELARAAEALAAGSVAGSPAQVAARAVSRHLTEPLRVGVVGRLSSGKSTLVNALLEQAVAPTSAGECTQVPCWFRHGTWEGAQLVRGDGRTAPVSLEGGRLPEGLPPGAFDDGARLEVTLPMPLLRQMTLVDTPGLASATDGVSERTAALVSASTIDSTTRVDALVVVLSGPLRAEEAATVAGLAERAQVGGAVAIAALTRVDLLDADPDTAWKKGLDLAQRMSAEHADLFADVVPVAGLLAEAGATGALDEHDARALSTLAAEMSAEQCRVALSDARVFLGWTSAVPADHRRRLVGHLGLYGIAVLLTALRDHPGGDAARLTDLCLHASGRDALVAAVSHRLTTRSDVLKATSAAGALRAAIDLLGADVAATGLVRDVLDSAALFPIRLHEVLAGLGRSRTPLPEPLAVQARAARDGLLPARSAEDAAGDAAQWRHWQMVADGHGRKAADAMVRALELSVRVTP